MKTVRKYAHASANGTGTQVAPGFSLMELVVTVAIVLIVAAIAIPLVQNAMGSYQFQSGVVSATGAIRSTRYQAIANGYPFQLVFSKANSTFQVQKDPTQTTFGTFDGNFANVGSALPLSSSAATPGLSADLTLQFSPSGAVKVVTVSSGTTTVTSCGGTGNPCQLVLAYGGKTETITVSAYGNINVTP
jgi:prepilin-type N-terminal cleavage/methylation domain-containing protein